MPKFELVQDGVVWTVPTTDGGQRPLLFETFGDAKSFVQSLGPDARWTARRHTDTSVDWKKREQDRFASGEYQQPAWMFMSFGWADSKLGMLAPRYPHVSKQHPNQIAYTPDDAFGAADRKLRSSPRAYLRKYHQSLTTEMVDMIVYEHELRYNTEFSYLIAEDEATAERVYVRGPDSCMCSPASAFGFGYHPARIYTGPDLYLAYLMNDESITARGVVWRDRKLYDCMYGDRNRLEQRLTRDGYNPGTFRGARLKKLRHYESYVCPYIDGGYVLEDDGEYFVLTDRAVGKRIYFCQSTDGYAEKGYICARCDCSNTGEGDSVICQPGEVEEWCNGCVDSWAIFVEGDHYDRGYFDSHGFECSGCDYPFLGEPALSNDYATLCKDCLASALAPCATCGHKTYKGECECE